MAARKNKLAGGILKDIEGDRKAKSGKKPASPASKPQSKHPPIPGHEFLGAGYNAFGRYAHASADEVRANIVDFFTEGSVDQQLYDESLPQVRQNVENAFTTMPTEIKLFYAKPPTMQYLPRFEASVDFSLDGSISSEQHSLATHAEVEGSYGLFAGEFTARYDSSDSKLATAKFYSAAARIFYYDLTMANYGMDPIKFMRPTVRQDLNDKSKDPEEIFDTYGTHYIYAVTIGSKIVFGHSVDTSKTTTSYDAAAEMKARYGEEGAEIGGGGGVAVTGAWEQASEGESIQVYCEGISDAQLGAIKAADTAPVAALQEGWHNPTLVDFPGTALRPIWDLCDSEDRKTQLKDHFDAYATAHGLFVGAEANITPLYLCNHPQHPTSYLLSQNRAGRTVDGTTWTGDPKAKPWLYVFDAQQPGTVPLYEYTFEGDGTYRRYETSRWDSWLTFFGWKKASGNPVGWVYDGLVPAPSAQSVDVYVYISEGPFYLYSTDSADGRDNGCWQLATTQPNIDGEMWMIWLAKQNRMDEADSLKPPSDADALAVKAFTSNVHWRGVTI
jgi:hypothetical protein